MNWTKLLESVSASVHDYLRLRNADLLAENRILRHQINGRVQLTPSERKELAEIGAKLGKKLLEEIATIAKPSTILAWHRTFSDHKQETSKRRKPVGRPRVDKEIEDLVVRMARENRSWGDDRIQGVLNHLGYTVSDQTVENILKRHGLSPAPERQKTVTWREFIRVHLDVLLATGFFNCEIWSGFGLLISSLLCLIHVARHQVHPVGMVKKIARSGVTRCGTGILGKTASESVPRDERQPPFHALGKSVCWPSVNARHIRDGPHRRQQRLDALRADDLREVA